MYQVETKENEFFLEIKGFLFLNVPLKSTMSFKNEGWKSSGDGEEADPPPILNTHSQGSACPKVKKVLRGPHAWPWEQFRVAPSYQAQSRADIFPSNF